MNQNYFPAVLSKADSTIFCSSLWRSPVQCKARLSLDYKLMGSERLRANRGCIFLPSPSPTHSGDVRAGLSMVGLKGRRKASSRKKPAGLHPCHPTPSRFEAEQRKKRKNRLSVKPSYGITALGKGHSSRGKAWASRALAVILISCSTNWTEPPAARPCPRCGGGRLPLFHFHSFALRWDEAKEEQSDKLGLGCLLGFFDCSILRIRQCKEYFPKKNVPICLQSVSLYCLLWAVPGFTGLASRL